MNENTGAGSSPGCSSQHGKIDCPAVQSWRRARLEAARRQLEFPQPRTQALGRRIPGAAGLVVFEADVDQPGQESPSRQHHGIRMEGEPDLRHDAGNPVAFQQKVIHGLLEQRQIWLVFQPRPNCLLVQNPVGLCAGGAHGGTFARIQDPKLNARFVGRDCHRSAEGVHFLHQVPLADAANGRVARHLAQRFDIVREQQRRATHPG